MASADSHFNPTNRKAPPLKRAYMSAGEAKKRPGRLLRTPGRHGKGGHGGADHDLLPEPENEDEAVQELPGASAAPFASPPADALRNRSSSLPATWQQLAMHPRMPQYLRNTLFELRALEVQKHHIHWQADGQALRWYQDTMAGYAALLHTLDSAEPGRHSKQAQSELQAGVVMQRRLIAHARGWQPLLLYKNNMQLLQHNKQFSWEEVVQAHRQMLDCAKISLSQRAMLLQAAITLSTSLAAAERHRSDALLAVYAIEGPPMRVRYARRLQHEMLARTYEDACNVEGSAIEDMWRAIFCCDTLGESHFWLKFTARFGMQLAQAIALEQLARLQTAGSGILLDVATLGELLQQDLLAPDPSRAPAPLPQLQHPPPGQRLSYPSDRQQDENLRSHHAVHGGRSLLTASSMRGMGEQTTELAHSADSPALAAGRLTPPPLPADWNLCQASSIADEPQFDANRTTAYGDYSSAPALLPQSHDAPPMSWERRHPKRQLS